MKLVFADTFFWIALTNPQDRHAKEAMRFDDLLSTGTVYTTEEVLTFFAGDEWLRNRAVKTVREVLSDLAVHVIPQSMNRLCLSLIFTPPAPTKATA